MNVGLDENVDTTNAVQLNLFILVFSPVTHANHVLSASVILLVALGQDSIGVEGLAESSSLVGFDPGVVVDYAHGSANQSGREWVQVFQLTATLNINVIAIPVEPDVYINNLAHARSKAREE